MDLLPRNVSNFSKEEYWNKFFSKRGSRTFEWYGEYPQLSGFLHKYIHPSDKFLNVGCGNSHLSVDLYDTGFHKNVNIDISNVAIKQMKEKYTMQRPGLKFLKMDLLQMSFENEEFNVVLDKGTLDALMNEDTEEASQKARQMFSEIKRVLKPCGRYICVSLLQDYILKNLLNWFADNDWFIRIHRCTEIEESAKSSSHIFPTFVVVCTKMKISMKSIMELDTSGTIIRVESTEKVLSSIKAIQEYMLYQHYIQNKNFIEEDVSMELYSPESQHPRYTFYIVDQSKHSSNKFAVFIVPQGRETEWLFATTSGRKQLIESAACERLIVVHLNRNHKYACLDEVKNELSSKVMDFSPLNFKANVKVPFLSVGSDIGQRILCYSNKSEASGDYIVEDVEGDGGEMFRRLIFLSNQNVIQSESKLIKGITKKSKKRKQKTKWEIEYNYLSCQHHTNMIAGLCFLPENKIETAHVLIVGLGGGSMPMFLRHNLREISLDVVELDSDIVKVALEWFALELDDKINVHVSDGIDFISNCVHTQKTYNVVMLDVDNKDTTAGLSCPPMSFVEITFLKQLYQIINPWVELEAFLSCAKTRKKKMVIFIRYIITKVKMITDIQLAIFSNILGVTLFVLVAIYHYVSVHHPKQSE